MTSNIGSPQLMEGVRDGQVTPHARDEVMRELRMALRPEFLNRIDDIVLFKPLSRGEIEKIVDLLVEDLRRRLAERRISLELTEPARRFIAESGYDPVYGARPLKRFLQHQLETRIGRAIVSGEVADGSALTVGMKGGELAVTSAPAKS
jgi:ATP-dependent Clp protease ATP-binding subunit ClpB